ncbi:MAG: DUF3696 domain-containing protein [Acidobacteria bacterium]|nr:DUF3696 domain-containing protein [Acidobacteriota bacterium]
MIPENMNEQGVVDLLDSIKHMTYLTAERIGPREAYTIEDNVVRPVVGAKGEFAVSVLDSFRDIEVSDRLRIDGEPNNLMRQVAARMGQFFPGFEMDLSRVRDANLAVMGMRTSTSTRFHRTTKCIGFGLTQIFPLVVAALASRPRGILIVENPEVHLHPFGQATMGGFLSEVADSGVQVILETHSDHVLNGVRLAVKKKQIKSSEVSIHFFKELGKNGQPQVQTLEMDNAGFIGHWPKGFFDQYESDMAALLDWEEKGS